VSVLLTERVRLGRTDLEISRLVLGGSVFGWTIDEEHSFRVLDAYAEAGGNMVDTADIYGDGESERIIGHWLKSRGMAGTMLIATKVGATKDGGANLSPKHILESSECSRSRLGVDYIDLYQAHVDDGGDWMAPLAMFGALVQEGDIRYVGCSNWSADRFTAVIDTATDLGATRYEAVQLRCNLLECDLTESYQDLIEQTGLGVLAYAPLAAGFLTGKYRTPSVSGPRAREIAPSLSEHGWATLAELDHAAELTGRTPAQLALRWVLDHPHVTAAVVSVTSPEQLKELLGALDPTGRDA